MATKGEARSVFAKYIDEPGPTPSVEKAQDHSSAQQMLDWLQRWPKPVVNRRDVRAYAPRALWDRQTMINAADVLVKNGWLVPIEPRRYDGFRWQIVRKPVVRPIASRQVGVSWTGNSTIG